MKLDQKGAIMAEYIWIDGSNGVRSKTKVSSIIIICISNVILVFVDACSRYRLSSHFLGRAANLT